MLVQILVWIIVGLVAGAVARLLVPGRDGLSIPGTILLGIVGSFLGGFLGYILFHKDADEGLFQPSGLIASIIGAIIALLAYRAVKKRNVGV